MTPVADLGPNDFITNGPGPAVQIKIKSPADAMNIVRLEVKDRSQKYRTVPATAFIDQDIVTTGTRADTSETVDMITSLAVGRLDRPATPPEDNRPTSAIKSGIAHLLGAAM